MIFSNTEIENNFNFTFNGNQIPLTTSHKHLGVSLSSDAKWGEYIENILKNVNKHISVLYAHYLNMHASFGIIVG